MLSSTMSLLIFCLLDLYMSALSEINTVIPTFFLLVLACYIFLLPFTFNLYASLYLKWVSCRQHRVGSYFLIHSDNLCLLIGAFRPLKFKLITDIVGLISTSSVSIFYLLPLFFVPIFVSHFFKKIIYLFGCARS